MQNRYTGDIGDFAKYGLLRALGEGLRLGVAWYLFPDEGHNEDGRHVDYLRTPDRWRHLDPELFDQLAVIAQSGERKVYRIESSGILPSTTFHSTTLDFEGSGEIRAKARAEWFRTALTGLADREVVFADPDNGLCEDNRCSASSRTHWKRIPLSEAHVLSAGRTGIIYHHNTRRAGGHFNEIQYWLQMLGSDSVALYWRRYSNRTFFVVQPTRLIRERIEEFVERWSPHFEYIGPTARPDPRRVQQKSGRPIEELPQGTGKTCPECGYGFSGPGWGGIDAHWKASHEEIMPYAEAWPIIKAGRRPSDVG